MESIPPSGCPAPPWWISAKPRTKDGSIHSTTCARLSDLVGLEQRTGFEGGYHGVDYHCTGINHRSCAFRRGSPYARRALHSPGLRTILGREPGVVEEALRTHPAPLGSLRQRPF